MVQTLRNMHYMGPLIIYFYIKPSIPPSKLFKISNKKIGG